MATKSTLTKWVYDAVDAHGGKAKLVDVARHIWTHHETELRSSGDLFYTWQYDMRWAAQHLRDNGKFKANQLCERGHWEIAR